MHAVLFQVTGNGISLVGDGAIIGGLIAAPFTLGLSLIASAVGGGICAVGGATSAGAGIAEIVISKRKVKQVQQAVEHDIKLSNEIQKIWSEITLECERVQRKYVYLIFSLKLEDVFAVLLVVAIDADRMERLKYMASHTFDICSGIGSGVSSILSGAQAIAGVVLTALIVKCAPKGAKAVTHCCRMAGVSSKIVTAAKVFRFATGVTPFTVGFALLGTGIDVASLIYNVYHICKKSDSSAGKELIKRRNELQEGKSHLEDMHGCLCELLGD